MTDHEVVVIGAGQAGLAAGHYLAQAAVPFVILEGAPRIGDTWRARWDSLRLFTPARYSALPGLPFPGDPWHYPDKDEVADYLETYAEKFALPVRYGMRVTALDRSGDGYLVRTADGTRRATAVIVATGAFQEPKLPSFAADLASEVFQMHSSRYRRPTQLPDGQILVVGAANSGLQLAAELSAAGTSRRIHLSIGSRLMPLPRRILGADVFWWLDNLGIMRMPTWLAGNKDALIGQSIRRLLHDADVTAHGRCVGASGRTARFADGDTLDVTAVVWATGYRPDYSWLRVPVLDDGRPSQRRGVTSSQGLYFLGLERMHTSGSSLLGWVRYDAKYIVSQITSSRPFEGTDPG